MRLLVKFIDEAFQFSGVYLFSTNNIYHKVHNYSFTLILILLSIGIAVDAIFPRNGAQSRLLSATYVFCGVYALIKRFSFFHTASETKRFVLALQNAFRYTDEVKLRCSYLNDASLLYVRRIVFYCLMLFIFAAYGSPFFGLLLGHPLNYCTIMYPIYVPWRVNTLYMFLVTWFFEAVLVMPVNIAIYSAAIFTIFSMIEFKREFDQIRKAVKTLELRSLELAHKTSRTEKRETNYKLRQTKLYQNIYLNHLKECIMHYQQIMRNFRIFGKWFNASFTIQLIECTTMISFLFYSVLKLNDFTLFFNLLAISFYLVTGLFFACFIGEHFIKMKQALEFTLYDITWYDQPKAATKLFSVFHQALTQNKMKLYGFNHFQASYNTFSKVSKTSYSSFNVLKKA